MDERDGIGPIGFRISPDDLRLDHPTGDVEEHEDTAFLRGRFAAIYAFCSVIARYFPRDPILGDSDRNKMLAKALDVAAEDALDHIDGMDVPAAFVNSFREARETDLPVILADLTDPRDSS